MVTTVDERHLIVEALLTWPRPDSEWRLLNPEGGNFEQHARNPRVNFSHLYKCADGKWRQFKDIEGKARPLTIAWARPSLDKPGPYTVALRSFTDNGKTIRVPVLKAYFDAHNRASMFAFDLIARKEVNGASLEFFPRRVVKAKPRMPWDRRPWHEIDVERIEEWDCVGMCFAPNPANFRARVLKCYTVAKAAPARSLSRRF